MDAGVVNNTATGVGQEPRAGHGDLQPLLDLDPGGPDVSTLLLTKTAAVTDVNGNGVTDLGDKIAWSFLVKNTGTVTVTTVAVTDPTAGAISCPATTLAPGVSTTCTSGAHTITQADVDAGVVNNTATATGKNPGQRHRDVQQLVHLDAGGPGLVSLQLTKTAAVTDVNGDGATDLGDTVTWSFLVKNTGTVRSPPWRSPTRRRVRSPARSRRLPRALDDLHRRGRTR